MTLLALAIAPGIAICIYIFMKDIHNQEPKRLLVASFLMGVATIIPAYFIESGLQPYFGNSLAETAVYAFLVVGLGEELSKYLVFRYYCFNLKSFDEPLDGIVYSVMVSMGFATFENINYVLMFGYETAFIRMFLSVPAHATFAVLMGYFGGKAKFDKENRTRYLVTGIIWAVFFHGTFDFFIFLQGNPQVNKYLSDGLLFSGAVFSFIIAIRLSRKQIKLHQDHSRAIYKNSQNV